MRHARDGVGVAIDVATRVLAVRGRSEPPEVENRDVRWGSLAREGVWAPTRNRQQIHIGIEFGAADRVATVIRPSLRIFAGIDEDVDLLAQTTATGVRFVAILQGPKAPVEFRFPLGLGEGMTLEQMPSGGFDVVHERYGATVGRFYAPWGIDSLFRPISADYRLDGTSIVMAVKHDGAQYPVVADPLYSR